MALDTIENDAEIARILAEEYNSSSQSNSYPSKKFKQQKENRDCLQADEDAEMAFILQIEEIVLSENKINDKTINPTDAELIKTHGDMTKALQPAGETDVMTRIMGMFVTIQARYVDCQAKNQVLIDQIQKLAVQLYPTLIAFKAQGRTGVSKAGVPSLAVGLITNVLQGNIGINDAKQIMNNMVQIWQGSNIWYEFLEQLVYILVAVTVPSFAQGAMGKIMGTISSSN